MEPFHHRGRVGVSKFAQKNPAVDHTHTHSSSALLLDLSGCGMWDNEIQALSCGRHYREIYLTLMV